MSELNLTVHERGQLAAIADLRWRLFINSLRTTRGKLEFLSRGLVSLAFLLGGLGGCFAMAAGAFYVLSAACGWRGFSWVSDLPARPYCSGPDWCCWHLRWLIC